MDRFKRWVLLSGNRYAVALGILALMTFVVLTPDLTRFYIRNTGPLYYMASALITGNVTLVTVVVAINQVVLSQELESPGSLRDEIESTAQFRQSALDRQTAPTDPAEFLQQLLRQTADRVRSLREILPEEAAESDDGPRLLSDLPEHCERVADELGSGPDDLSSVIVPTLGVSYAEYIRECHRLQARYDRDERLHSTLDALTSDLEGLDVSRQYFTTAVMKEELATLSRSLLYVSVVAVSTPIALLLQLSTYAAASPPMPTLFALAVLTAVFGLTPLALLIAYMLRIATVADFIAAITPFEG